MGKLKIYMEYKFKKGGAEFHISEGDSIKVKTKEGIYEGTLIDVGAFSEDFDIETKDGVENISCEEVIDIIPV